MQHLKNRYKQIIPLSVLYSVLCATILLAFPKTGGDIKENAVLGAARSKKENTTNLPLRITRGQTTAIQPITADNKTFSLPQKSVLGSNTSSKSLQTCDSIGICDKIHFTDGYTKQQKTDYYKAIIEVMGGITAHLPKPGVLQDTLYSLTLSNNTGERRGRGGSQTIVIYTQDIETVQEFREILSHELGHIIDLGVVKGESYIQDSDFTLGGKPQFSKDDPSLIFYRFSRSDSQTRLADVKYTDFVGGYAMTSPYEDFAESLNMYLWHHDVFVAMAKNSSIIQKKLLYINNLLQGFFFSADTTGGASFIQNPQQRPWDSTRMSLE